MRCHSGTLSKVAIAKRSLALPKNKMGQQKFFLPNVSNQLAKEMQCAGDFRNNLVCPAMRKKSQMAFPLYSTESEAMQMLLRRPRFTGSSTRHSNHMYMHTETRKVNSCYGYETKLTL
uniref:Uncharacterized protein n=1 Tax=Ixodes ricinus TaxID=34613 RepID=A0A0K8RDN4_IXORI